MEEKVAFLTFFFFFFFAYAKAPSGGSKMFSSHLSPRKLSLFPLWHHSDSLTSGGIKNLFRSSHLSCHCTFWRLYLCAAGGKLSGVCSRAKVSGWCWRFRSSGWSRGPHDWNYREGDFFFCVKDIRVFLKFTFKVQFEVLIVFCEGKKLSSKVSLPVKMQS